MSKQFCVFELETGFLKFYFRAWYQLSIFTSTIMCEGLSAVAPKYFIWDKGTC